MDQTAFNQIVTYYVQQRLKGMDFGQIRAELTEKKATPDTINRLIKAIDNEELYKVERKSNQQKGIEYLLLGFLLLVVPCVLLTPNDFTKDATKEAIYWLCGLGFTFGIPLIGLGIRKHLQTPTDHKGYPTIRNSASGERSINYHSTECFDPD